MTNTEKNIIKTIAYFDIFHYPVTNEEVLLYHSLSSNQFLIDKALDSLVSQSIIFKLDIFYSLHNDMAIRDRRKKGNAMALVEMKNAVKAANILSHFPYVQGLALSGSLSKNFANEDTDIDFFIITRANRLWIARTLLHLFYKLARVSGRQKWFCMNYYIDECALCIPEQNIFTAIEITTLIPMQGIPSFVNFSKANNWTRNYFPGLHPIPEGGKPIKRYFARKLVELLFNGRLGNALDQWLMKISEKRWKKKAARQKVNNKGVRIGMLVNRHFSKPDPAHFQSRILQQYEKKTEQLLAEKAISFEA